MPLRSHPERLSGAIALLAHGAVRKRQLEVRVSQPHDHARTHIVLRNRGMGRDTNAQHHDGGVRELPAEELRFCVNPSRILVSSCRPVIHLLRRAQERTAESQCNGAHAGDSHHGNLRAVTRVSIN